jgi:hypothetical protein
MIELRSLQCLMDDARVMVVTSVTPSCLCPGPRPGKCSVRSRNQRLRHASAPSDRLVHPSTTWSCAMPCCRVYKPARNGGAFTDRSGQSRLHLCALRKPPGQTALLAGRSGVCTDLGNGDLVSERSSSHSLKRSDVLDEQPRAQQSGPNRQDRVVSVELPGVPSGRE